MSYKGVSRRNAVLEPYWGIVALGRFFVRISLHLVLGLLVPKGELEFKFLSIPESSRCIS